MTTCTGHISVHFNMDIQSNVRNLFHIDHMSHLCTVPLITGVQVGMVNVHVECLRPAEDWKSCVMCYVCITAITFPQPQPYITIL